MPLRSSGSQVGAPGFAAVLSALVPGLGQVYQERWIRGIIALLVPMLALTLTGAFVAIADPITALVIRHARGATLVVVGGLFLYHLSTIVDAFAGGLHGPRSLLGKRAADYALLAVVVLAVATLYGNVYAQGNAWATLAGRIFAPVAKAVAPGAAAPAGPPAWTGKERLNVLLLGVDKRDGEVGSPENTDTLVVLSLDPLNRTASMLSIPRDTLVTIPGHGPDKINAAYAYGGPELAERSVEQVLGIRLNSYALVDFNAFVRIVDSLGGVLIDVKRPIRDEAYPTADFGVRRLNIVAGPQLMHGDVALEYARSRHDSNDFSRSRRQQQVLAAIRARLAQDGMLARVPTLMGDVGTLVETNFDPGNILPLAGLGGGIDSNAIRSEVLLPCGGDSPRCELREQNDSGGYYLIPEPAKVRDLVAQLFYDPKVRQEGARVEVRAAGARSGIAQEVADRLEARAFGILRVTTGTAGRSVILVRSGAKRYTAEQLRTQLGGLLIQDAPPGETGDADIIVVVGNDFRGLATDLGR
jgi:LCP family protein required for cell wall assembly